MGVFSKLKDVLFDVEEEEIPVITRDEKPVINKDEENPIKEVKMPKEDLIEEFEPLKEKYEDIEEIPTPKREFNFPMDDFDDEMPTRSKRDFFDEEFTSRTSIREPRKEEAVKRKEEYEYDYSRLDIKNTKKEEVKSFKPSPVISPVYGILDTNYTKDDVIVKNDGSKRKNNKSPNLDDVRKKAYGKKEESKTLEEPLKTLDEILIDNEEEIIPAPKMKEPKIIEDPILDDNTPIGVYDDELPDEPYADEEMEQTKEESQDDSLESDLFNLIDSMYEEKNEREEE